MGEEVPWKWALLIQAVTAGALKYELHIPTVVIPGSDHNPPSNQGGFMKIKHEHIRMAMNAWARPDGEKVPAAGITRLILKLGMTFPELYDDSHPEALARNTQKNFRWIEKDTLMQLKNSGVVTSDRKGNATFAGDQNAQPQFSLFSGAGGTRERLVRDADDFVAVAIAGFNQMNRGGPAGNAVAVH